MDQSFPCLCWLVWIQAVSLGVPEREQHENMNLEPYPEDYGSYSSISTSRRDRLFFFLRNKRRNLFLLNILNMRETRQSPVKFLHWLILLVLPCFVICICWALTSSQIIQLYLSLLCGKALWCMISSFHVCTYRSLKLDFDELNRLNCLNLSVRQIFQPLTHSCGLLQNLREWSNIFNIWRIDLVILFQ